MARHQNPTLVTLGRAIRIFREATGMIQKEMANKLGYTNAWLSNLETGQLRPRQDQLTAIEEMLAIPPGVLFVIYAQLDKESLPGYDRSWPDEVQQASVVRTYQTTVIPELLQTEDYTRTLHPNDEASVQARLARQGILTREEPAPPMLHCVLDEAVLFRIRGTQTTMHDQLQHLIKTIAPPRLTVQILRAADNPYSFGTFGIATVDDGEVGVIQTAVRDIVTSNRDDLTALTTAWEATRTFALSQRESIELIQQIADERWA